MSLYSANVPSTSTKHTRNEKNPYYYSMKFPLTATPHTIDRKETTKPTNINKVRNTHLLTWLKLLA
jgi:hypothetical protein